MTVKPRVFAGPDVAGAAAILGAPVVRTKTEPHGDGDVLRLSLIVLAMFVTTAGAPLPCDGSTPVRGRSLTLERKRAPHQG